MVIRRFPPLTSADEDGLLAIGGDLEPESIVLAYSQGIFPWPLSNDLLAWFAPPYRAVIEVDHVHLSRSLRREMRRGRVTYSINRAFGEVIRGCALATNRRGQRGTWITPMLIDAYLVLHDRGIAHSIEVWEGESLVGGLYGVSLGAMFAAESMYYVRPNASKLALVYLMEHLRARGVGWFDVQVLTPTTVAFGAVEIERSEFMERLQSALAQEIDLFGER